MNGVRIFLGDRVIRSINTLIKKSICTSLITRCGIFGCNIIIMSGSVMRIAIVVDESIIRDIIMGSGFINSPIIPDASNSGINAHIVVSVVDHIGIMKSFHTNLPAWNGVNFSVL